MGKLIVDGGRAVRQSPMLIIILCITAFGGMSSEGFDRLQTDILYRTLVSSSGTTQACRLVRHHQYRQHAAGTCCNGACEAAHRYQQSPDYRTRIVCLQHTLLVSVVVFGLTGNFFLALAAYWSASVLRRVDIPISMTWLTRIVLPGCGQR